MCGISGFISFQPQPATSMITSMTRLIRHRGPDDEGFLLFESPYTPPLVCGGENTPSAVYATRLTYSPTRRVDDASETPVILALGHRRLSILDLSPAGHQPMCDSTQRYWVVYNGEIYNHLELRAELETLGHQFFTHCDTEVLLAAYSQWGEASLNRFNGMFAFLLYDRTSQTLFAARDRFGIKPLYYWIAPDGSIAFGSEIKQFTVLPGWQARVNNQRVYDFLVWSLTDHTEETCFAGVYQIRPGESLRIDCRSYWQGPTFNPKTALATQRWYKLDQNPVDLSFEEATEQVHALLQDSVQLRLRADVPVGSCLSGGLDSSSIVCLMAQLLQGQGTQQTFTACADVDGFDERHWAETVVAHTGTTPHYLYPQLENLWEILPRLTWHQDEPFASTSIYAQWSVFQAAHQAGITVMLDGQGSDEQFCGYHPYFNTLIREYVQQGRLWKAWQEANAVRTIHGTSKNQQFQVVLGMLLPQKLQNYGRKLLGKTTWHPNWLNLTEEITDYHNPCQRDNNRLDSVTAFSHQQLCTTNLPMLLHWEDRNSMAHHIEARVPFVDYRLIELVYNLPNTYKISNGETKRVLRSAMQKVLPEVIRQRRDKLAFVTPEELWLRQEQPETFRQSVAEAIEQSQGLLNSSALTITDKIINGNSPFSSLPWRFISLGGWIEAFKVKI
ncbi:asparagine synthase (glutamine-hydrolyzing) [Laspinema olomoucense]|uniref:asparagine synthase (glutamine-hydrolyzing) n=1 Tax=Laspinema olomoucense TaxID=3231600 RepID=UPI0021BB0A00|nr:asparagine synthase (glutamine-hydrolyzing) [Laspinema sp. D3c]MCT7995238.1 asparagine synthase (glutamine-hydrolyzing) [Laspinema sp. D3c]